jgi:hypothetical protein
VTTDSRLHIGEFLSQALVQCHDTRKTMTGAAKDTTTIGKDTPAKIPQRKRSRAGETRTQRDTSAESSLAMPHERDQSVDMTPETPDPKIRQAARDVEVGRQDTSKAIETDKAYQKQK